MTANVYEAALRYLGLGWAVLPILPNSKIPASEHGVHDASKDPEQIAAWFLSNTDLNIAVAAGEKSGIAVIDVDPRNGGDDSWEKWQQDHGKIDDGALQLTPSGGQHYIVNYDSRVRSSKLADGIDYLADGKYFLVYPSQIEGKRYEWEGSLDPFDGVAPSPMPEAYVAAHLANNDRRRSIQRESAPLLVGQRNNGLTSLAGSMRRYGMTAQEIHAALAIANEERCAIPLPSSEIRQIVASVCRYAPDSDVVTETVVGDAIAQRLLTGGKDRITEPWLQCGEDLCAQPAPIKWVIKGWVPASGMGMIHGESGIGKTFVAIDMACCIATGTSWCGIPVTAGVVVYLAGEGNFGLRSRLAAWRQRHGGLSLNGLRVSRGGCDLDTPEGLAMVQAELRQLPSLPAFVVVDTLHRFMVGDENTAVDARRMISACAALQAEFGATVLLVHHTGHAQDAKDRARGSSAWRGALDVELSLASRGDNRLVLTQKKQKDAEPAHPLHFATHKIEIEGWWDDLGLPVRSLVIKQSDSPVEERKPPTGKAQRQLLTELERRASDGGPHVWTETELREIGRGLSMHRNSARDAVLGLQQLGYLTPTVGGSRLTSNPAETQPCTK